MATHPTKKSTAKAHTAPKLHYSKTALIAEYERTHHIIGKALTVMIGCALVYFFVMMVFVGQSNTTHEDFIKQFGDRITIEYDGKKLPIYEQGQ